MNFEMCLQVDLPSAFLCVCGYVLTDADRW